MQPAIRPRPAPPAPPIGAGRPGRGACRSAIRALFEEYAAAIEPAAWRLSGGSIPGLTGRRRRSEWQEFFQGVSDIDVELSVTGLQCHRDAAEAHFAGVYVFNNPSTGKVQREPVGFQAALRREGARWRIASLK